MSFRPGRERCLGTKIQVPARQASYLGQNRDGDACLAQQEDSEKTGSMYSLTADHFSIGCRARAGDPFNQSDGGRYLEDAVLAGLDGVGVFSTNAVLPASLYLSTKPAFLGNTPWPAFGPGVANWGVTNVIPARASIP